MYPGGEASHAISSLVLTAILVRFGTLVLSDTTVGPETVHVLRMKACRRAVSSRSVPSGGGWRRIVGGFTSMGLLG